MAKCKIESVTDQRHYSLIYHDVLDSDKLDGVYEKMLFVGLKRFADSNNRCFPSIKKLAKVTGMSRSCVIDKLAALERKGIIKSEARTRPDGGRTSNVYTIYDYAGMWREESSEPDQLETQHMIKALESKGFTVSKGKEPDIVAATSDPEFLTNNSNTENDIKKCKERQESEEYSIEEIKQYFGFTALINDSPTEAREYESVMCILYDVLNTTKPNIRIDGEDKPRMIVKSRLLKLTHWNIRYAVSKYKEQTSRISNPRSYMLTVLYHAPEQGQLDAANQVAHDMAI